MATTPPTKKPEKTPEAIVEKLLDDPNTPKIAEKLEMKLEDYVALVVHYVMNPNEQPMLNIVKDEDLAKNGLKPISAGEMNAYMRESVAVAEAAVGSGFSEAKKAPVSMASLPQLQVDPAKQSPDLKADLEKALRRGRGGKS
jgi:hypothetical protein